MKLPSIDFLTMKKKNKSLVGLEIKDDGFAVVSCRGTKEGRTVQILDLLETDAALEDSATLAAFVEKHKLHKKACNVVLSPGSYQLLLVEAPDVPEEEMRDALKWRLKELIQISPESTAVEIFALPADGSVGNKNMLFKPH